MFQRSLAGLCVILATPLLPLAAEVTSPGKVTHVTLYRDQAMVTRTIEIADQAGQFELVVPSLPEQLNPDSMYAEGSEGLEVRAVEFRSRAVSEAPREEIRQMESQIEEVQQQIALNQKQQELMAKRSEYLDKLEGFVAPTATAELTHGVLNAESLEHLSKFSFEQREEVAKQQVLLAKESTDLARQLQLLQRKMAEITAGATRTQREAVVYLHKHAEGPESLRLNYLVGSCGWSPSYVLRAQNGGDSVDVEYNGIIRQMSGEDWSGVSLTLSTASPALSASGPGLAPFRVTLAPEAIPAPPAQVAAQSSGMPFPSQPGKAMGQADFVQKVQSIRDRQNAAIVMNNYALNFADNSAASWSINESANDMQCLELTADRTDMQALRGVGIRTPEGPSLSYQLESAVSLHSRRDQQMIRIMQCDMASRFYHIATPLLTSFVYREAELTNGSSEDLLNGPVTVYLDGRFVGRSEIPTVARGQSLVVGFGADPQLRTRRELASRSEGVQGGNRELTFSYRLVVENYKDKPASVRVLDRLPTSDRESDVRVRLAEMEDSLSTDKIYLRVDRPQGILRWDIEAPAGATGENARLVNYTYSVDHDRSYNLAASIGSEQQQKEFEELQRLRNRR